MSEQPASQLSSHNVAHTTHATSLTTPQTTPQTAPQTTPLTTWHQANGGKLVDFAGYSMPIQYRSITEEHHAVRQACGLFDIGHMGRLRLSGAQVVKMLDYLCTRRISNMDIGQVRYSLLCHEAGGVIDDILVSREADHQFHLVVNASNHAVVLAELLATASDYDDVMVTDLTQQQAMLAVQGPQAIKILASLGISLPNLRYYRFADTQWHGQDLRLSRTGYTGEDGYECFASAELIVDLWQALIAGGAMACGLGARDTLRLEAGMPLYGHELNTKRSPLAAGLSFAVDLDKPFRGHDAIAREQLAPLRQVLVGLKGSGRRPPRAHYPVLDDSNEVVGEVSSGTMSPTLGYPIAMAWVAESCLHSDIALKVDIRGRSTEPVEIVPLPFYRRSK